MKFLILSCGCAAGLLAGAAAHAQGVPIMDGTADALYGTALSVQNTNTQFGNANSGDPINGGGGSEIDQVFATVAGGRLYVLVAGNLETNFNKLAVFVDSEAGGSNSINGAALPGGVDSFCCGGFPPPDGTNTNNVGALQRMQGLTFDAGFEADHFLAFTHGFENALDPQLGFYASSAHYADLTDGTAGRAGALGMQLAQKGLPNVLRGTTRDFDVDGDVDGADFLIWQRNAGATGANRLQGDADGNGTVDDLDLAGWQASYGFSAPNAGFGGDYFSPQNPTIDDSNVLIGPALPGLSQGELIDKVYAFGPGGATDNAGTGAITRELEFVLPPVAGTTNAASHRNMENIVDLQMAIDNSNVAGVSGDAGTGVPYQTPTAEDPTTVLTGIEFSIPLSEIGSPAGNIKLMIFVNGGGHDYAANQFAGVGILDANLGGNGFGGHTGDLSGVIMTQFAGDQFVTVTQSSPAGAVPEPSAGLLATLAALAFGRRRGSALSRQQRTSEFDVGD